MISYKKIRESVVTKWIVLYYTFFFLFGSYLVLLILITTLNFMLLNSSQKSITLQGFNVNINGIDYQIWDLPQFYISIIIGASIIFFCTWLLTRLVKTKSAFNYLGFKKIKKEDFKWFGYSAIILILGIFLTQVLGIKPDIQISTETFFDKLLLVLGLGIFGPILEETLIRGYLLNNMNDILNDKMQWITIIVTALIFSTFHFQYDIFGLIYIFIMGVFLAIMTLKTKNIWFAICFHCVGNIYATLPFLI